MKLGTKEIVRLPGSQGKMKLGKWENSKIFWIAG